MSNIRRSAGALVAKNASTVSLSSAISQAASTTPPSAPHNLNRLNPSTSILDLSSLRSWFACNFRFLALPDKVLFHLTSTNHATWAGFSIRFGLFQYINNRHP
ncbi:hypothetical protein CF326_g9998 [Tilletia indica]|uniref:Uncharacterized protein n=1 Tax=Tilletia indica TaxID=43049 RepID=A0A177TXN7_9BASI|nr:hypothetical protein CF326_g9998 [Tilletia indica]KAE8239456.1 hypothetical protein A4X13_0g8196 [Tilletia indica]